MNQNLFLRTSSSADLYHCVENLPIVDFHNHISVEDIVTNRRFNHLTELWLAPDPYKHRLMRICGVPEYLITGNADPYEKFKTFCDIFPLLAGNPVYDWSRMELSRVFGISEVPSRETAQRIWNETGEMLKSPEYSNNAILSRFHIEYQSPVVSLLDDLTPFNRPSLAPSLRGDNLLVPSAEFRAELAKSSNVKITDTGSYLRAIAVQLDRLSAAGCRFADHALDDGFFESDRNDERAEMLKLLGVEYAKRGWTLLLHLDAKRKTSERLARLAGPAGGYAAVGGNFDLSALCNLLGGMERAGGLPDTVLFPLNMSDQAPLAVMQGSFSEDGIPSKVQLGPAWWWCDHAMGIRNTLSCIASFGVLSQFIGMTTDSRSILSFVRHDYFRRLLCSWLDEENDRSDWGLSFENLGNIAVRICYQNAYDKIKKQEK